MSSIKNLKAAILLCRASGITSFLWGHRGLGKSALHMQVARERGWGFINMRCSQMEASDLRGLPDKDERGLTVYRPPADLPQGHSSDTKCPACDLEMTIEEANEQGIEDFQYCKGILFLDELNRGEDDVLQAGFELVLDYKVGMYRVPKGWSVHCAGNFMDGYMVNNFSDPAFLDRFCHLQLNNDEEYQKGWTEYMTKFPASDKIVQFVAFNSNHLIGNVKGEMGFSIQPSPRSWEFVARVEEACAKEDGYRPEVKRMVLAGLVGMALAQHYDQFTCEVTPKDIMGQGVSPNATKLKNLSRNQLVGLVWGLSANAKQVEKTKKMMTNVIDFMEWLVQKGGERDLAVSLGRALCENESTDLAGAMLSNPKLAKLAGRWKDKNKKKGDLSWIKTINDREDLQALMSKVSFGQKI